MQTNEENPCRYHTTIYPLVDVDHIQRIRKLDVRLALLDIGEEGPDQYFTDAIQDFEFFAFPLPALESLSFSVQYELDIDSHMELPRELFSWGPLPPTKLRHLALHGCYGGPVRAVNNLTSLELSGDVDAFDPLQLDQRTFLPLISNNTSLVFLRLLHVSFPDRARLSRVTPVKLPELKFLELMDVHELPGFSGLIEVPAFETLSTLWVLTQERKFFYDVPGFLVRAESDNGFQLIYDTPSVGDMAPGWLGVTHGANPSPAFVRFAGEGELGWTGERKIEVPPLPLFVNAKVLEIGASFASSWYRNFWEDVGKVGLQLTILRLEVAEGMSPDVAKSVKDLVKARFQKGTPLEKLERMTSEGMGEEDEEKAKKLREEFRAGLNIDQYLAAQ